MTSELDILEDILKNQKPIDAQIQSAEQELAALDEKRKELQARIKQLKGQKQSIADEQLPFDRLYESNVTNDSTRE
jgi:chromosome segregation ATPase